MPVIETGPGSAAAAEWLLRHGALQLLCLPPGLALPRRMVIQTSGDDVRDATMAVAASVLRHVPAEAMLFGSQPLEAPHAERGGYLQLLNELRHVALGQQAGSKAEPVAGDGDAQLLHQLDVLPGSMLVLGVSAADDLGRDRLARFLEGPVARSVLFVRPFELDVAAGR